MALTMSAVQNVFRLLFTMRKHNIMFMNHECMTTVDFHQIHLIIRYPIIIFIFKQSTDYIVAMIFSVFLYL